jgi:hypothetical protein
MLLYRKDDLIKDETKVMCFHRCICQIIIDCIFWYIYILFDSSTHRNNIHFLINVDNVVLKYSMPILMDWNISSSAQISIFNSWSLGSKPLRHTNDCFSDVRLIIIYSFTSRQNFFPLIFFSLIWRHHYCWWRAAKFRCMLVAQGL